MLIVFNYESTDTSYTAFAGICQIDPKTKRPLVAFVYMNIRNNDFVNKFNTEKLFGTILHEIHHGLGFVQGYIDKFYNRQTKLTWNINDVAENSADYPIKIKMPLLKTWVNNHLGCNQNLAVPLENVASSGSGGSHFEAFILGNEMLNPSTFYNTQYTGATISYIDSMGFFISKEPNTKMEETLAWGYKGGCNLLRDSQSCTSNPFVCKKDGVAVCSMDHFSIGTCSLDHVGKKDEMTGCSAFREKLDCRYQNALGTRCAELLIGGFQANATCVEIDCKDAGGGNFNVDLKLKNGLVTCNSGQTGDLKDIGTTKDKVVCPNANVICRTGMNCPKDCSNQGRCKSNGSCWCFPDYDGADCSEINMNPYRLGVIDWFGNLLKFNLMFLLILLAYF